MDTDSDLKKSLLEFDQALGQFIQAFAEVEAAMQITLWNYARVDAKTGQALFSGVRAIEGSKLISRLCEASDPGPKARDDLANIFGQLRVINETRNLIVHYGARGVTDEKITSNRLTALRKKGLKEYPVTSAILYAMMSDLIKIKTHLMIEHQGLPDEFRKKAREGFNDVLSAPWLYKPPPAPKSE